MQTPAHDARTVAAMLLVERASADAVAALRRASIRCILIKGPLQQAWLAAAGPPRASVDVDLLVDPSEAEAAGRVFAELGYRQEPEVTPGVVHHADLWTAPGRVPIEVHWNLWETDRSLAWPILAAETEPAQLCGESVEVPNEAARCLIIALHAAHHGAGEEAPGHDLERAIAAADRAAWERATELAVALDAAPAFVAGLELVPEGSQLRADLGLEAVPLTERLALNLAPPVAGAPGFYWLGQQTGLGAKTRFVLRKLFPPPEFMRFKYPYARRGTGQLALTYAYRPLWMAYWALPGFLAWRRARAAARGSGQKSGLG